MAILGSRVARSSNAPPCWSKSRLQFIRRWRRRSASICDLLPDTDRALLARAPDWFPTSERWRLFSRARRFRGLGLRSRPILLTIVGIGILEGASGNISPATVVCQMGQRSLLMKSPSRIGCPYARRPPNIPHRRFSRNGASES